MSVDLVVRELALAFLKMFWAHAASPCQNNSGEIRDERRPEVHVEDPQGIGSCGLHQRADRASRRLVPLRQAAEADRIAPGGAGRGDVRGLDPVPGDIRPDGVDGLAVGRQGDIHRARGRDGIELHGVGREAQRPEAAEHLPPEVVVPHAGDEARVGAEGPALEGEVGGGAPELLARGQQVPEHLAEGQDLVGHGRSTPSPIPPSTHGDAAPAAPSHRARRHRGVLHSTTEGGLASGEFTSD